jgi:phospholipase/carboxylesterase
MSELLSAVEIDPPGRPEGVVVWLHGLGADGHDFEPIVPVLGLPRARFVFPHAPSMPVTINGGMVMPAWYDILAIGGGGEKEADVRRSAAQIRAVVEREEQSGVPADRIILAGFSQGAAMALHVGTRYPRALRGIMVLSGYEVLAPLREREETIANRPTPMLFCHGTADPVVPIAAGRLAYEAHAHPDRPAEWHQFPMGHEVSPSELTVIRQWLGARFGRAA